MNNKIYISCEEAIKKQCFFAEGSFSNRQYLFVKDFCGDEGMYDVYIKGSETVVDSYNKENIVQFKNVKFYILKNTNITAY